MGHFKTVPLEIDHGQAAICVEWFLLVELKTLSSLDC